MFLRLEVNNNSCSKLVIDVWLFVLDFSLHWISNSLRQETPQKEGNVKRILQLVCNIAVVPNLGNVDSIICEI